MQAAQKAQWSKLVRSNAQWITKWRLSVIGRRRAAGEPWERLTPLKTRWSRRQLTKGSGKPCSMCKERTADKYTLIDECWIESARKETNKHKVHSSAGQGEPLGWSFPAWRQNSMNLRWPDAYDLWVEGAKPCAKKCKQRCSREEVLSCPAEAEESDKGKTEPLEPAAGTPANGNER